MSKEATSYRIVLSTTESTREYRDIEPILIAFGLVDIGGISTKNKIFENWLLYYFRNCS